MEKRNYNKKNKNILVGIKCYSEVHNKIECSLGNCFNNSKQFTPFPHFSHETTSCKLRTAVPQLEKSIGRSEKLKTTYFHAEFPEFILSQRLDINSLELLTIDVALKLWGHLWRGLRLTVRCNNEVAVAALNSGRCRNAFVNSCLREVCFLAAKHEFEIRVVHLPDALNCEADVLFALEHPLARQKTIPASHHARPPR